MTHSGKDPDGHHLRVAFMACSGLASRERDVTRSSFARSDLGPLQLCTLSPDQSLPLNQVYRRPRSRRDA